MCSFHGLLHSRPTTEAEPFNSHKRMPKDEYLGDYFFGWRFKVTDRPLSQMTQVSRWSPIKTLSPRLDQDAPTPWEAAVQTLPLQVCIQNCSSKQLQQGVPRSHWKWRQRWWSPSGHNCWALSDFMIGYICFRIFAIQAIRVFVPVRFFSQFSCYNMKQENKNIRIHSTGVKCLVGSWCQLQDFVAEILGLQFWWADSPLGVVALPHPGSALWTLSFVTASPLQLAISHANASNNKNTAKKHQKPP